MPGDRLRHRLGGIRSAPYSLRPEHGHWRDDLDRLTKGPLAKLLTQSQTEAGCQRFVVRMFDL
jgi:hypothetical protein